MSQKSRQNVNKGVSTVSSTVSGAVSGGMAFGPPGAFIGGALGLVSGLFGGDTPSEQGNPYEPHPLWGRVAGDYVDLIDKQRKELPAKIAEAREVYGFSDQEAKQLVERSTIGLSETQEEELRNLKSVLGKRQGGLSSGSALNRIASTTKGIKREMANLRAEKVMQATEMQRLGKQKGFEAQEKLESDLRSNFGRHAGQGFGQGQGTQGQKGFGKPLMDTFGEIAGNKDFQQWLGGNDGNLPLSLPTPNVRDAVDTGTAGVAATSGPQYTPLQPIAGLAGSEREMMSGQINQNTPIPMYNGGQVSLPSPSPYQVSPYSNDYIQGVPNTLNNGQRVNPNAVNITGEQWAIGPNGERIRIRHNGGPVSAGVPYLVNKGETVTTKAGKHTFTSDQVVIPALKGRVTTQKKQGKHGKKGKKHGKKGRGNHNIRGGAKGGIKGTIMRQAKGDK